MSGALEKRLEREGSDTRPIQQNGEVTIPWELREKLGLSYRDRVVVSESDDGDGIEITPVSSE